LWREGYVRGGRTRFFVRALGSGEEHPLAPAGDPRDDLAVLLHGWPEDGSSWAHVAPLLVEAGYRVVCPDLKGFGASDSPKRGYDAETLADEISQLVRNLHARKAVLVGHDWGGATALATAFRHPGRVRALVLASSPFRHIDLRAAWHIPLLNLPVVPHVALRAAGGQLIPAAIRHAAVVQEPFTDEVLERYVDAVARPGSRGWLGYYRTLSRRAVIDLGLRQLRRRARFLPDPQRPHRLRVPTTVVWGERDRVTPLHLGERAARDLDAPLVTIPDVGHFVHEEAPERFAEVVLELTGSVGDQPDPAEHAR
jgi:epoxide hydrolase 4